VENYNSKEPTYLIPTKLVNGLILAAVAGIASCGIYMVTWSVSDSAWKAGLDVRLDTIENLVYSGALPRTDERLKSLEQWRRDHEQGHEKRNN
jgi:hypothetical protein